MMKQSDFWIYSEENEKVGGVYWEFAKASDEELKATDVYFEDVLEIIKRVKDSELKAALCYKKWSKNKGRRIFINNRYFFNRTNKKINRERNLDGMYK